MKESDPYGCKRTLELADDRVTLWTKLREFYHKFAADYLPRRSAIEWNASQAPRNSLAALCL